jgi:hypothetical protein
MPRRGRSPRDRQPGCLELDTPLKRNGLPQAEFAGWFFTVASDPAQALVKIIRHPLVKNRSYFDEVSDRDWLPLVQ